MNGLNKKTLVACVAAEDALAKVAKFVAARKVRAEAGAIREWGELGDVNRILEMLRESGVEEAQ